MLKTSRRGYKLRHGQDKTNGTTRFADMRMEKWYTSTPRFSLTGVWYISKNTIALIQFWINPTPITNFWILNHSWIFDHKTDVLCKSHGVSKLNEWDISNS